MTVVIAGFTVIFLVVVACGGFAAAYLRTQENKQLRNMLQTADPVSRRSQVSFLRPTPVEAGFLRILRSTDLIKRMTALLAQAGVGWTPSKWIGLSAALGFAGLTAGLQVPTPLRPFVAAGFAALLAGLPSIFVFRRRAKRLDQFSEQFPEALDFLSRSLRAGHALSIGLEMLSSESPEPLGSILRLLVNDLRLGSPQEAALERLNYLVPMLDVQFFIAAVLLQSETGGNLSEILSKLSYIIRERFRLKGQVRSVSAHGRITAGVLIAMPFTVAVLMFLISPAYMMVLFNTHAGRTLLLGALTAQTVGVFVVKRVIDIKV